MLSPGAKGWINKYFDLIEGGEISLDLLRPEGIRKLHFMHLTLGNSGIVFGYPLQMIFAKNLDDTQWTNEEKLKLLLFESHLFVYTQVHKDVPFEKEKFVHALFDFYHFHSAPAINKVFGLFKKQKKLDVLEAVLTKRVDIKLNLLENKWWVNSMSNAFVYLDVILFDDYEFNGRPASLTSYSSYARNVLTAITLSAYSDGKIESKEKDMFNVFLASASLDEEQRDRSKTRFKVGASYEDFSLYISKHWLLKRFLLDMSALLIFSNHEALEQEITFLEEMAEHFEIPPFELQETLAIVENFILKSEDKATFLSDTASYGKVYKSLTKRWSKIILRNKDKIAVELKQSKELLALIRKSTKTDLTKEEKEIVKEQLKDIAKSVPSLTIFMLPGGTILMPLLLRLLPDLVPSAFRENQIDTDEAKSHKNQ